MNRIVLSFILACFILPLHADEVPRTEDEPRKRSKTALCIGIGSYADKSHLRWAASDALEVAAALSKNGFQVSCITHDAVTLQNVQKALERKPALVYFAGHYAGNELLVRDGGILITDVARHTKFMLLDCCNAGKDIGTRGDTVVFAAGTGYVFEGGANGLFTRHLLDWLTPASGTRKSGLVDYVSQQVSRETGDWQRPVIGRL